MSDLNIDVICANTPAAKGRVERAHQTLQDRLVKELRLRGICTMEDANAYLPEFMDDYNRRLARAARNDHDALKEELHSLTGLPRSLAETEEMKREDLEPIAKMSLEDGSLIYNAEEADFEDALGVLQNAW